MSIYRDCVGFVATSFGPSFRHTIAFRALWGFAPDPLTTGSAHEPCWGCPPQTPVIGSRSALAMVPGVPQPVTPSAYEDARRQLGKFYALLNDDPHFFG